GMVFRPVKYQQLAASSGSTDFAGLFIGFSFFLLIAAVMLVAMLFRLSVEQRSRQLGLLSACGFAPSQLRNLCLKEGLLLAVIGGGFIDCWRGWIDRGGGAICRRRDGENRQHRRVSGRRIGAIAGGVVFYVCTTSAQRSCDGAAFAFVARDAECDAEPDAELV